MPILEMHTERLEFLFMATNLLTERAAGTVLPRAVCNQRLLFGGKDMPKPKQLPDLFAPQPEDGVPEPFGDELEPWQCPQCGGDLDNCECDGVRCGCEYCYCTVRTIAGETCHNCSVGAHQG